MSEPKDKTSVVSPAVAQTSIPRHLGFILDGNRRWAKSRGLDSLQGHGHGYENFKRVAELAFDKGVEYVSAYVFSTENWSRPPEEVDYLMDLLFKVATTEMEEVHEKNIRVRFLGSRDRLSPKIVEAITAAEIKTASNTRGTIAFCLNYGGQQEIVDAVRDLMGSHEDLQMEDVTIESITKHLYAKDIPALDLVVRTSGEQRISNFMLWRAAYAELLFAEPNWPDFSETDLDAALEEYSQRQRRFGA